MRRAALLLVILLASIPVFAQQAGVIAPPIYPVFQNINGSIPVALGFVCTTASGGTSPLFTYQNASLATPNADPIQLDASGRAVSGSAYVPIYLQAANYRFTLYAAGFGNTCNGIQVGTLIWQQDGIYDFGQLISAGLATVAIPSALIGSFPAAGTAGRLERALNGTRGLWIDNGTQWVPQNGGVINVLEFGAKGDGTTNDSTAINNAVGIAEAINGTVYFPATTPSGASANYNIGTTTITSTGPVTLQCSRGTPITYTGSGYAISLGSTSSNTANYSLQGCSILLRADSANAIQVEQLHNWGIRDVYVEGNASGTQTSVCLSVDGRAIDSLFGTVDGMTCNHVKIGFQPLSTGSVNKATTIAFTGFNSFGDDIAGSHCVDYGASGNGDGYTFLGGNCEHTDVGISSNGGAGHSGHLSRFIGYRFEGNDTDDISLDAFSQGFEFIGDLGIANVIVPANTSTLCNQFTGNLNASGLPYPDVQCGAGIINPLMNNTGSVGVAGQAFADGEFIGINTSVAPAITTDDLPGPGISSPAGSTTWFGGGASGAGGVNWKCGADSSIDWHCEFQAGGAGTTFRNLYVNPGNGGIYLPLGFDLPHVPIYVNNAAAISGGLPVGALYRSGGDPDVISIVH